jgi:hypothetical protein
VAKRQRHVDETLRGEEHGPVWEYQLQRGLPNVARRKPPRGGPERLEMSLVC